MTTYYIDPSGNDISGNGTLALPWATVNKACSTVTSSDNTIYMEQNN